MTLKLVYATIMLYLRKCNSSVKQHFMSKRHKLVFNPIYLVLASEMQWLYFHDLTYERAVYKYVITVQFTQKLRDM